MSRVRRPSSQTLSVLRALAARPSEWRYGYELGAELGLRSGSLYPILIRLCDRGILDATWESEPSPGRPPRHLYRLTTAGREYARTHATRPSAAARSVRRPELRRI
jgi:PadR family transcriptional regulator, regulatory protein PadR